MKCWAYALMGLLLASGALAARTAYAQQEWYPGEGLEQGLLVKYRIASFDYKRGQPFEATIWFGERDGRGDWVTDVIVQEGDKAVTSKMTLSRLNLVPIGFEVTEEFKPYRTAIRDSLGWIGSYANEKEPKSLSGGTWGVIAAIGGGGIVVQPTGSEKVQAAGRTWDTAIVGFHYGVVSKIWIADGFPLPVAAKVFTLTTQHPIPPQFEYQLLETRITDTPPEPPAAGEVELPTPPLSKKTTTGAFSVDLYWQPITIEPGKPTTVGVVFFDARGNLVRDAQYDLLIKDAAGNTVIDVKNIVTVEGQARQEVTFESAGPATVTVRYHGSLGGVPEQIIETAEFELVVVPEFPLGAAAVMVAIVATMVALTRFRRISIPRL